MRVLIVLMIADVLNTIQDVLMIHQVSTGISLMWFAVDILTAVWIIVRARSISRSERSK